jgi:hypothetical protein
MASNQAMFASVVTDSSPVLGAGDDEPATSQEAFDPVRRIGLEGLNACPGSFPGCRH